MNATKYSAEVRGDATNHWMVARFDWTDGYVGIDQDGDRILLSPRQIEILIEFIDRKGRGSEQNEAQR